jgi:hypothetical protein
MTLSLYLITDSFSKYTSFITLVFQVSSTAKSIIKVVWIGGAGRILVVNKDFNETPYAPSFMGRG